MPVKYPQRILNRLSNSLMNKSFSKRVGELFAHIQDLMDTATHTMIHRVREKGEPKNRLFDFFSSAGDAYYKKYTDIKKGKESNTDS